MYAPAKTGEFPSDIPQFLCCDKYLKDSKHNSLHLTLKYAQIFVLGHYCTCSLKVTVSLVLHSQKTVHFSEQIMSVDKISEHIFPPNGGYCLYKIYSCICTCTCSTWIFKNTLIFSTNECHVCHCKSHYLPTLKSSL